MNIENALATQLEKVLMAADEASALMLDLSYLESNDPNLNYVRLAVNPRNLKLSADTRYKAKVLEEKLNNEILNGNGAFSHRFYFQTLEDQKEPFLIIKEDDSSTYSYSADYLSSRLGYHQIFMTFRELFEYVSFQGCIDLVRKKHTESGFEAALFRSKSDYFISSDFHIKALVSTLQLQGYNWFLKYHDIRIEECVEFMINEALPELFKVDGLRFIPSTESSSDVEKNRHLAAELESILKQYALYAKNGKIDHERLSFESSQLHIGEVPSRLEKKYAYLCDDGVKSVMNSFFYKHSFLNSFEKSESKAPNFYSLLRTKEIKLEDYRDFEKTIIQELINDRYLEISQNGVIKIANNNILTILGIFYHQDVISYWHLPSQFKHEVDKLETQGKARFESKLFTIAEREYLNYQLNKKFTNGLDLRNKYAHGSNSPSKQSHQSDYFKFLKLIVLITYKILDDLALQQIAKSSN